MLYEFIQSLTPQKIKRYIVASTLLIVFITLFVWLYNHSFVSITNDGAPNIVSYQLTRDSSKPIVFTSNSQRVKRLVNRGTYRVITKKGTDSYVAIVSAGGFLSTKTIDAKLISERERSFVGKNPQTCMVYDKILFSYQCGGSVTSLVSHVPATASTPTYINKTVGAPSSWLIKGAVSGPGENVYVLVLSPMESENGSHYYLYEIGPSMQVINQTVLSDLNPSDQTYQIQRYKNGFIAYNDPFNKAFYYSSPNSAATALTINTKPDSSEPPYAVTISNDVITVAYPTTVEKKDKTNASEGPVGSTSRIMVGTDGKFQLLTLNGNYSNVTACGNRKMCLFGDGNISVYDISGKKPKFLYKFNGVTDMQSFGNSILFNSGGNIIDFDVDKATGYISYSLGDYKYCGFANAGNAYVLCLVNAKGEKNALRINKDAKFVDDFDKKIYTLNQLVYVSSTSVYGDYVYISPNLGKLLYNSKTGTFSNDQTTKEAAKNAINETIDKLGIDRQRYKITLYQVD